MAALEVCQPGFDVRTCPDWAYLFNSDWPSLQIVFEKLITVTAPSASIYHNLPYPPLTMVYDATNNGGRVPGMQITPTEIILNLYSGSQTFLVRCYNVDISKDAAYPLPIAAQAKLPYDKNFGMKIVKANRGIGSNNLNDFILHTRGQSPAVLNVCTQNGQYYSSTGLVPGQYYNPSGNPNPLPAIVYPLQTSYIPWVWGALEITANNWQQIDPSKINYVSSNHSLVIGTQSSLYNGATLVILRDPLFYPNVLQVTY